MKRCGICDGTGWIDDPPRTWASEPGEDRCHACLGDCELDDDAPDEWDEADWKYWRQQEDATDAWLDREEKNVE